MVLRCTTVRCTTATRAESRTMQIARCSGGGKRTDSLLRDAFEKFYAGCGLTSSSITMEETLPIKLSGADYRALAELRYRIRHFLRENDAAARQLGLEPQQYLVLLTIRGLPQDMKPTIRTLAERLGLKHNSTVELINRLQSHGCVQRIRSPEDRRCVLVSLLPRGEKLLEQVAQQRITEVRAGGVELVDAMTAVLRYKRRQRKTREKGSIRKP
jgi:DNA-binding MarR family transcriptional regulator